MRYCKKCGAVLEVNNRADWCEKCALHQLWWALFLIVCSGLLSYFTLFH